MEKFSIMQNGRDQGKDGSDGKYAKYAKYAKTRKDSGFTLVEVMAVMIIVAVLAAIAIPKLTSSSETARRNADIATGHEVKSALDRYQVENGIYLKYSEVGSQEGALISVNFVPKYISKLDKSTTQQKVEDGQKGFGTAILPATGVTYPEPARLIMLFLTNDGTAAEVRVYGKDLKEILWTSSI